MARFEHDLRVRLRDRRNRLYRCGHRTWVNEAGQMLAWMRREPYLASLLREAEAADIDFEEWKAEGLTDRMDIDLHEAEHHRAKVCLALFEQRDPNAYGYQIGGGDNYDDEVRAFTEVIVDPVVHFLEDRIEDGSAVLGILERYKRRSEWFHQADLHRRYRADTTRGEAALDAHLREYLVDQGIPFPFSQPG